MKVQTIEFGQPSNLTFSRHEFAYQCLCELLPRAPSRVVSDIGADLDIGVDNNRMSFLIKKEGGMWQGFDKFPRSPEIHQWDLDGPMPIEFQPAGIVLLLDVLEHLKNPGLAVKNITNALLPGGYLVLTFPNPLWSRSRFHALAKGYPICFTKSDLDLNHHVFTPWPHIVMKYLKDEGFILQKYVTLDGPTNWPPLTLNILHYSLRCAFALLCMIIEWHEPDACGMSYGLVARKSI